MAKVKVKIQSNLKEKLKSNLETAKTEIAARVLPEIRQRIEAGFSPVEFGGEKNLNTGGGKRFIGYSESYSEQIENGWLPYEKKLRPVNMTLSDQMLDSLYSRIVRNGVEIGFTDEKAEYHNTEGAGKSKVIRRLLPKAGERFTPEIQNMIVDIIEKHIKD